MQLQATSGAPLSPKCERVVRALQFQNPDRLPVLYLNRDQHEGDVVVCWNLAFQDETRTTEWGIKFESLNDGTMGQMTGHPIAEWSDLETYKFPELQPEKRREVLRQFVAEWPDHYRLASLNLSGFTCYCGLRGFENAMTDFAFDFEHANFLLTKIIDFEMELIRVAAQENMHGIILWDDWGHQDGLLIAPEMWRQWFRPHYERQFRLAHELGLTVWFHCCGKIDAIVQDFHEIGVDVINISQPNVVDLPRVGAGLRGKQAFMLPISYQTVSISGTPEDIQAEAERLFGLLGTEQGGFVGYVEDYKCMGMSETNYQACKLAFNRLKPDTACATAP
ncbi:MAG TPA: uroporphyrinogen decarboxylase family protein [Candidatus Sumerlaeota bacterium]|nr:uroporphyrinogen decarboxylase family protein [Candidatus Sumerlaeota bacterium]HPK01299.1 uroporphyrinogen decarboxylase family protein [Candidatus Sumerlaeota bacterium]